MKNLDNLHFSWQPQLTYNKTWNLAVNERETGKSVDSWLALWRAYHYQNRPSIVLRRKTVDITSAYIDDINNLLNKFLESPVQLLYLKGDIKQGIVDIKLGDANLTYTPAMVKQLPIFVRIIALNLPMSRIKSLCLPNLKYIFIDEFIVNLRIGEKYLKDEPLSIKEIYTTFNREAETPIKILMAGNPYSIFCPIFSHLGIENSKIHPGAFVVGPNYTLNCFQASPELKAKILEKNPMYQFDDSYRRYAFDGRNVNDQNILLQKTEPQGFKLCYVFKMGDRFVSLHRKGSNFWACTHKSDWLEKISKRRKIICFNFADMMNGSVKLAAQDRMNLYGFKDAMDQRKITFNCVDASYMCEDIYTML